MTSDIATVTRGEFLRTRILDIQSQLTELQTQVATGKKTDKLSSYGTDTRSLLNLRLARDSTNTYMATIKQTQGRMDLTQKVLGRIYDLANQVKNSIATVNNPQAQGSGPSSIPLKTLALNAIREISDLLNEAPDGRYLFAGYSASTPPMIQPGDASQPASPLGQVNTLSQVTYPLDTTTASGDTLYAGITSFFATNSNYYQGDTTAGSRVTVRVDVGVDIAYGVRGDDPAIRTIMQAMYALATNDLSTTTEGGWNRLASLASMDLAAGVKQLAQVQGDLSQKQTTVNDIATRHASFSVALQTQIGDIENVDPADAIQRITLLQTQLQASYQLISNLRDLSITNYL
jgi:flagellar hook-associated protein 3 FlgL